MNIINIKRTEHQKKKETIVFFNGMDDPHLNLDHFDLISTWA